MDGFLTGTVKNKEKYKTLSVWMAITDKSSMTPTTAEAKFKNIHTTYGMVAKETKTSPSGLEGESKLCQLNFRI